jgi:hypothetical protein
LILIPICFLELQIKNGAYFGDPMKLDLLIQLHIKALAGPAVAHMVVVDRWPRGSLEARDLKIDGDQAMEIARLIPRGHARVQPGVNVTSDGSQHLAINAELFDGDKMRHWAASIVQPWGGTRPGGEDLAKVADLARAVLTAAQTDPQVLYWLLG